MAGNVIPDECRVVVNYRFAPDKDLAGRGDHVREVFEGYEVDDRRRRGRRAARAWTGRRRPPSSRRSAPRPRPSTAGPTSRDSAPSAIPAVNFGPGDPSVAHADDEHVPVAQLRACERALLTWLS